jgi:Xaa-Pro dipeptidase
MIKGNLDAIAVIAGPNMAYLTGGDFFLMERPTVLIFSRNQRPLAILPSLEVDSFQALNFDSEIVAWKDSEGYLDAFVKAGKIIGKVEKIGVEGQRMRVFEFNAMKHGFPNAEIVNAHNEIASIRLCKDESEIQNLKKAIKISEDALEEILKNVKEGITESELAQMLIVEQYNRGAHGIAVHPLVLIGGNSSLPHGHAGNRKLKIGDAL